MVQFPSDRICSFPPVVSPQGNKLILGSMPGEASLKAGEYYAHPRNQFWPLMGGLFGSSPELPYNDRLEELRNAGISLWDVLATCERPGSLDSAIKNETVNDFRSFFAENSSITHIFFNGAKAEQMFQRYVFPDLRETNNLEFLRLPSTSPAHAGLSYEKKLEAWRILQAHLPARTI